MSVAVSQTFWESVAEDVDAFHHPHPVELQTRERRRPHRTENPFYRMLGDVDDCLVWLIASAALAVVVLLVHWTWQTTILCLAIVLIAYAVLMDDVGNPTGCESIFLVALAFIINPIYISFCITTRSK
jgi:hypothetical protein